MSPRVREQHLQIVWRSSSQSAHATGFPQLKGTTQSVSQLLLGPRKTCSRAKLRRVARSAIHSTSIVSLTCAFFLSVTPVKPLKQSITLFSKCSAFLPPFVC
jgi:hypothetical protein